MLCSLLPVAIPGNTFLWFTSPTCCRTECWSVLMQSFTWETNSLPVFCKHTITCWRPVESTCKMTGLGAALEALSAVYSGSCRIVCFRAKGNIQAFSLFTLTTRLQFKKNKCKCLRNGLLSRSEIPLKLFLLQECHIIFILTPVVLFFCDVWFGVQFHRPPPVTWSCYSNSKAFSENAPSPKNEVWLSSPAVISD